MTPTSHSIELDGAQGEGGGQIVRSALTLSLLTGRPLRVLNVRGGRRRPGLLRQHLTGLEAAQVVGDAELRGGVLGSTSFDFVPRSRPRSGHHRFAVGSAGSAVLVLQTILPALLLADGVSTLVVEGGTHADWAPSFDFFDRVYLDQLRRLGFDVRARIERYGFYPAGGGRIVVEITPVEPQRLRSLALLERGQDRGRRARVLIAQLPTRIAERELEKISRRLDWGEDDLEIVSTSQSISPGNAVLLEVQSEHVTELFQAFGKHGRSAEKVASDAIRSTKGYLRCTAPVGEFLADQLLLPMLLTGGGRFRTIRVSRHTASHLEVIRTFVELRADVHAEPGDSTAHLVELDCDRIV